MGHKANCGIQSVKQRKGKCWQAGREKQSDRKRK